ncbi:MAG TPA: DUF2486 family protein [Paraburkholderia sp.]
MSDPNDNSIPVLKEILVPGHAAQARPEAGGAAAEPARDAQMPREPGFKAEPTFAPQPAHTDEPALAPEPVLTPEQTRSPQPVLAPESAAAPAPAQRPASEPEPLTSAQAAQAAESKPAAQPQPQHAAEHAYPKKRSRLHHGAEARHPHDEHAHVSPGVFDRAEPAAPLEAGAIVPPDIAHATEAAAPSQPDADAIAERLRGRFAGFLTGEGRGIIEARCRDALQEHTTLLVSQITREVALTLETEMTGWVREAVEEELARRSGRG